MNNTNTQEDRLAKIAEAYQNSKVIAPKQSVEDFVADIKTEEVVAEHGLLDAQKTDMEDEQQFLHTIEAEKIDEEDQAIGLSPAMREVNGLSTEREYELDIGECAHNIATTSFNFKEWHGQVEGKTDFTMKMVSDEHINNKG